ncbi:MAG: choice-of-anchor J domain-containing protein, partial [Candidatus Cloacimonetes bacterium]|nr:choice-of-anchor J domain-containing protein [Candidatus Cloacimonadota bacterium]
MNLNKLLLIVLILSLGTFSGLFAQVNITIGDGTGSNTTTGAPTPYGTFYKNFHQQFLYRVSEIEDAGGGAGPINSLAFNVINLNNCTAMPNFSIKIKTTTQTELTTTFEVGEYTEVFFQNDFMPVAGMNVHTFNTPFQWDGASNIIVDIITTLIPGSYAQNASVQLTETGFNSSLRYQSDSIDASTSATGTLSMNRSNVTFNMTAVQVTDPPNPANMISPADGSTILSNSASLIWSSGGGIPSGYKVYFGTTNPPPFVEDIGFNYIYDVADLLGETTYYWQIVPYNTIGDATNCPVWSFSTLRANQLAESFESTVFPPVGWANGSTGNWTRSTSTPLFHGVAHAYKFTSTTLEYYLSTPMLSVVAGDSFEFYTRATNTSQVLRVGYSTDRVQWTQIGGDITYAATGIWYPVNIDLSTLAGNNYYFAFITPLATSTGSIYVDHVIGPDLASLAPGAPILTAPVDEAVDVSNFPTLSWTAALTGGVPNEYSIYLDANPNPTTLIGTSATTSYTLETALTYSTQYYWKVVASNDAGASEASEVFSFTVLDNPTISTFPWIEDFGTVTGDWPVLNWTQLSGIFPTVDGTSTQWYRDEWLNGPTGNNAAKINIYGTTRKGWLVTPPVALPDGGYELKFDLGLTDYANSDPIEDPTSQQDDKFIVAMSDTPNMSNPVTLREWNNTGSEYVYNQIPHTGTEVTLYLTGVSGTKYFAFYGESTVSGGDNDLFVDNVQVRQTPTGPVFTINPTEHDFGTVLVGAAPSREFLVSNTGIGALTINSIDLTGDQYFTLSGLPTLPLVLNIGESFVFSAVYAPTAEGEHAATITIIDNLGRTTHTVPLQGEGFDATITTLPASENWDTAVVPDFPLGWSTIYNATTTSAYLRTSTTSPYSTRNCVQMANSSDANAQLYLISPPVSTEIPVNGLRVR